MKYYAKIIHKTHITYIKTNFAVQFYGMPNGKVFFIYARRSEFKPGLEFVFAEHKEFYYDYVNDRLMHSENGKLKIAINKELIDKPNPKFKIFKISTNIHSYTDAYNKLNQIAKEIFNNNSTKTVSLNLKTALKFRNNVS